MIVLDILPDRTPKMPLPDRNHPIEAFFLHRSHEPLRIRLESRGSGRQADDLPAGSGERLAERQREQRIPIVDQEALAP